MFGDARQGPWDALVQDFTDLLELGRVTHIVVRLLMAALLGGVLGFERERAGKVAGLRTHMLVAVGSAFFVLVPQLDDRSDAEIARVIQGVITGIGFLGGGVILKLKEREQVRGLTSAASIWLTTAIGIAVGLGRLGSALLAAIVAFLILGTLHRLDRAIGGEDTES